MLICKAPLRVSLFGGGTDFPEFYEKHDGTTIVSFAITQYMHVIWNTRPTGGCRLTYSEVEELPTFEDAQHTLVRAFAQKYGIEEPGTLSIISDLPKGTGLGSSSSLSVCLTHLSGACRMGSFNLATTSYEVERHITGCGVQDHLPAAFGGFRAYQLMERGFIPMRTAPISLCSQIEDYGVLLYTGITRCAQDILPSWKDEAVLLDLKSIARVFRHRIVEADLFLTADLLKETWKIKSSIPNVVSEELMAQYDKAISLGAMAGKLLGAGAGGCWFFLVDRLERESFVEKMGLRRIPFKIAGPGVRKKEI